MCVYYKKGPLIFPPPPPSSHALLLLRHWKSWELCRFCHLAQKLKIARLPLWLLLHYWTTALLQCWKWNFWASRRTQACEIFSHWLMTDGSSSSSCILVVHWSWNSSFRIPMPDGSSSRSLYTSCSLADLSNFQQPKTIKGDQILWSNTEQNRTSESKEQKPNLSE